MPYTDARDFVRTLVKRYGYSGAARYLARRRIGNPRWFLLLAGDMLPRRPRG